MGRLARTIGTLAATVCAVAAAPFPTPGQDRPQRPADPSPKDKADLARKKIVGRVAAEAAAKAGFDANEQERVAKVAEAQMEATLKAQAARLEQMNREALEQLRPTFASELRLLTSAAGPSSEQRKEIAIEAGRTLREYIDKSTKPGAANQIVRLKSPANEPQRLVRMHVEAAAWARLSNQQSARYRTEVEVKEHARREAVLLNVVASIDRHLRLEPRQRERLVIALRTHWDDRDYPANATWIDYDRYVAIVPDLYMLDILKEEQLAVWRDLRKYHFSGLRGTDVLAGIPQIEPEQVDDADVLAALGEEVKK